MTQTFSSGVEKGLVLSFSPLPFHLPHQPVSPSSQQQPPQRLRLRLRPAPPPPRHRSAAFKNESPFRPKTTSSQNDLLLFILFLVLVLFRILFLFRVLLLVVLFLVLLRVGLLV